MVESCCEGLFFVWSALAAVPRLKRGPNWDNKPHPWREGLANGGGLEDDDVFARWRHGANLIHTQLDTNKQCKYRAKRPTALM